MPTGFMTLEATVELFDRDGSLIDGKKVIVRDKDSYQKLIGDGNARVSIGLDEHMGGPYGYSGVKIRVNVTVTCNQSEAVIQETETTVLNECIRFVDDHIGHATQMLEAHLKQHYSREGS